MLRSATVGKFQPAFSISAHFFINIAKYILSEMPDATVY